MFMSRAREKCSIGPLLPSVLAVGCFRAADVRCRGSPMADILCGTEAEQPWTRMDPAPQDANLPVPAFACRLQVDLILVH